MLTHQTRADPTARVGRSGSTGPIVPRKTGFETEPRVILLSSRTMRGHRRQDVVGARNGTSSTSSGRSR